MPKSRAIRRLQSTDKKKAPVLNAKQLKRLLYVASDTRNPERNRLIVLLLFCSGFRITETAVIEIKDVLWRSGKIRSKVVIPAKYCKNGKPGHVFFYHKKLLKAFEEYLDLRVENKLMFDGSNEYRGLRKKSKLILSENKSGYSLKKKKRMSKDGTINESWACDTLQELVTRWGRDAGIKDFTTHSGRRTFGTRLSRKGGSEEFLCAMLRHETTDMPYEYIEPNIPFARKLLQVIYTFPENEEMKIEL